MHPGIQKSFDPRRKGVWTPAGVRLTGLACALCYCMGVAMLGISSSQAGLVWRVDFNGSGNDTLSLSNFTGWTVSATSRTQTFANVDGGPVTSNIVMRLLSSGGTWTTAQRNMNAGTATNLYRDLVQVNAAMTISVTNLIPGAAYGVRLWFYDDDFQAASVQSYTNMTDGAASFLGTITNVAANNLAAGNAGLPNSLYDSRYTLYREITAGLAGTLDLLIVPPAGVNAKLNALEITEIVAAAPALTWSGTNFVESPSNDGVIGTTLSLALTSDTFTGSDGDEFVASGKAAVENVPAGLTALLTRQSAGMLAMTLSGQATAHAAGDSISNLTVVLSNSAFASGVASNIAGSTRTDLGVSYSDPPEISYDATLFSEADENDGAMTNTLLLTLSGGLFNGTNGENFATSLASIGNVPAGLVPILSRQSPSNLLFSLTGRAYPHTASSSVSNLTVSLLEGAVSNVAPAYVTGAVKSNIRVAFMDPPPMTGLVWRVDFNGASGDTSSTSNFTGWTVSNTSRTQSFANVEGGRTSLMTASLQGVGGSIWSGYERTMTSGSVTNLFRDGMQFNNAGGGITLSLSGLVADRFYTLRMWYYDKTFEIGAIQSFTNVSGGANTSLGMLTNSAGTPDRLYDSRYVLTAYVVAASNGTLAISMTPATAINTKLNAFELAEGIPPAAITYSDTVFGEASGNDGSIGNTLALALVSETWTGTNGDDLIASGNAAVLNVPPGLSAVLTRESDSTLILSLAGQATLHAQEDSMAGLSVIFPDTAFQGGVASNVAGFSRSDISVVFADPPTVDVGGGGFAESSTNNGVMGNALSIVLMNGVWQGTNNENFIGSGRATAGHVPPGLTAVVSRVNASNLTFSLTGQAAVHAADNSISSLSLAFNDNAVSNVAAAYVAGASRSNLWVNFLDPSVLSGNVAVFTEAPQNNGAISNSIALTLVNATLAGGNGDDFIGTRASVSHVPAGLTAILTRQSETNLLFSLTGQAAAHALSNSVANLTLVLSNAAFVGIPASNVAGATRSDLRVGFVDPPALGYDAIQFTEGIANDGSIGNSLLLTLSNEVFAGENGDDLVATGRASAGNVPPGLTAVLTRQSATTLVFSLVGQAESHASGNSVSNVSLSLLNPAFAYQAAAAVAGSARSDLQVKFVDSVILSADGTVFNESAMNDGSISTVIRLTLVNSLFAGTDGDDFIASGRAVAANVPSGLIPVLTRQSGTNLLFSMAGRSVAHASSNGLSNLSLVLNDSAFAAVAAASVPGSTQSGLVINFTDPIAAMRTNDSFIYPAGALHEVSGGAWSTLGSTSEVVTVMNGNLSNGWEEPLGRMVSLGGKGVNDSASLKIGPLPTTSYTNGTLFYSLLFRIERTNGLSTVGSAANSGMCGFHKSSANTGTAFLLFKASNGGLTNGVVGLGYASSGVTPVWAPSVLATGVTALVVVEYEFINGGTNDVVRLWFNPNYRVYGLAEPPPPTLVITNNAVADVVPLTVFQFNQKANTPGVVVDDLRIGRTWADVTPPAVRGTVYVVR